MQVGTMVHYMPGVFGGIPSLPYKARRCMPATITRSMGTVVNLVVFPDGTNDLHLEKVPNPLPIRWEQSVALGPADELEDVTLAEYHLKEACTH